MLKNKPKPGRIRVLELLEMHGTLRPIQLHTLTGLSRQRIHSLLRDYVRKGVITKKGVSPRTWYSLSKSSATKK